MSGRLRKRGTTRPWYTRPGCARHCPCLYHGLGARTMTQA